MPGEMCIQREKGRAPLLEGGAGGTLGSGTAAPLAHGGFTRTASLTPTWVGGILQISLFK